MKRLISALLVISMMVSLTGWVSAADDGASIENFVKSKTYREGQFTDVPSSAWYSESVATVYQYGLMNGNSSTTFNPNGYITEAEAYAIAARLHRIYTTGSDDFTEIKQEMEEMRPDVLRWVYENPSNPAYIEFYEAWYSVYAYYLFYHVSTLYYPVYPYLGAVPDGAPYVDSVNPISREYFATIIANALPESVFQAINNIGTIPDVSFDFNPEVYLLYRAGILTGNDERGTFAPYSYIERSAVAAIISRIVIPAQRKELSISRFGVDKQAFDVSLGDSVVVTVGRNASDVVVACENLSEDVQIDIEYGEWSGDKIKVRLTPKNAGEATVRIYDVAAPEEYVDVTVFVEHTGDPVLHIRETNLSISEPTTIMVAAYGSDFTLYCEYDTDMAGIEWGEWDGNDIPLTITPKKDGTTTVRVYIVEYPEQSIDITVSSKITQSGTTTNPFDGGNFSEEEYYVLAREACESAKMGLMYPHSFDLVSAEAGFVNGTPAVLLSFFALDGSGEREWTVKAYTYSPNGKRISSWTTWNPGVEYVSLADMDVERILQP